MKLKRTSGKGRRWKKGHSCVSNSQNTKHREAARGCFFQKVDGSSGLTKEAIAQHNDALREAKVVGAEGGVVDSVAEIGDQLEALSVDAEDLQSAGRTFNTFATNFTTCTIPAFEKFFRTFSTTSELHTRMLAIHAAAQEYMTESGMPETSTSYFCSLMVSLEGVADNEADVAANLSLMARVVRRVSIQVLQAKFDSFAATLASCLNHYQDSTNSTLVTNAVGSLSVLLRAQPRGQWANPNTMALMHTILAYCVHEKPKIRKTAQYNVSAILKGSTFMLGEEVSKTSHPAAVMVAEYCVKQLRTASEMGNTKTTLHCLVLLRQVIMAFPRKQLKVACECVVSIMQLGRPLTNTCGMQALYSLLVSEPSREVFPADTNAALVCALTSEVRGHTSRAAAVIPGKNDPQPACAWITVITAALINLFKVDEPVAVKAMASWFTQLVPYWQSDHEEVQTKVLESFEVLLSDCIASYCKSQQGGDDVVTIFQTVEEALSFQYQSAWGCVFKCLDACYRAIGPSIPSIVQPSLKHLCELMENPRLPERGSLERAIGGAVRALGPQALMAIVPLQVTGDITEDEKYLWVLPIMKKYVANTQLCYFEDFFVHLAGKCFVILNALKEKVQDSSLLAKTYTLVEKQIWAMLPSFCNKATDVEAALGNEKFARILCDHIKFRSDTRLVVMEALRTLVSDNLDNPGRLATYAKNYLPALFNVYLTPPHPKGGSSSDDSTTISAGQRNAAHHTIAVYLQIVPKDKCSEFLGLIMSKYNSETEEFRKQALLDLARPFIPHLSVELLQRLYEKVVPLISGNKGYKEQKAAYRLLEVLVGTETAEAQQFIMNNVEGLCEILLKSLSSTAPSSRAPRLRCVRHVLLQLKTDMEAERLEAVMQQVVGECVMCCGKSMSVATRKNAFLLLSEVGATAKKHFNYSSEETVKYGLQLLVAGLTGSPSLAANSVLAITSLTYQYKDIMSQDTIKSLVPVMAAQLACRSREIVGSCLSFIKSCLVIFPVPVMSDLVDGLMKALCTMTEDCQRKYRLKTRDIFDRLMRKFGADRIMGLVPPEQTVMYKRLRNMRKLAARKQREREEARRNKGHESEEEDFAARAVPASLDEILAEIDTDHEDDAEEEGRGKGKNKKSRKMEEKKGGGKKNMWIKEEGEEVVDLLDASAGQAIVSGRPTLKAARGRNAAGEELRGFKTDKKTGKLIITEDGKMEEETETKIDFMEDIDEYLGLKRGAAEGKVKNRKRTLSGGSDEPAQPPNKVTAGSSGKKKGNKKVKFDYGADFRSKKAGGDMMKKGKTSPYAYVQFTKERLNKRKKAKYAGQFTSLVRGAKKGVAKGTRKKMRSKK